MTVTVTVTVTMTLTRRASPRGASAPKNQKFDILKLGGVKKSTDRQQEIYQLINRSKVISADQKLDQHNKSLMNIYKF